MSLCRTTLEDPDVCAQVAPTSRTHATGALGYVSTTTAAIMEATDGYETS
jgi:hypothetical protein